MITSPGDKQREQLLDQARRPPAPALTISITLRGVARLLTSSSSEWQPTNFLPFGRPVDELVDLARSCG